MQYLFGVAAILAGVGLILKTEWIIQNFGQSAWAEEHFGYSGGTRLMYKTIGIIIIFFGFLLVTNLLQGFLMATLGKIFIH